MLKLGLTGGIAAGKSTVGEMLAKLGAHVIRADEIAHRLMQPGTEVYRQVVESFGPEILNSDGVVNRARLANAAFTPDAGGKTRIDELNAIVHPAVLSRQEEWLAETSRQHPDSIAVVEAALILEAGAASQFDSLLVVTCRPEQRAERWARSRGVDLATARDEITRRAAAQLPDEEKTKAADYVIENSGSIDETESQVRALFPQLLARARQGSLARAPVKGQTGI